MQLGHAPDTVDGGIGPIFTLDPILYTCCRKDVKVFSDIITVSLHFHKFSGLQTLGSRDGGTQCVTEYKFAFSERNLLRELFLPLF